MNPKEVIVGYVADDHYGEYREDAMPQKGDDLGKGGRGGCK